MNKILTIVVPTYNVEKYLSRCLDSLLYDEKTNKKIEIIVVNDGSKDNSLKIANEYKEKYPDSVLVIDKENGGHGSTINAGLKIATGKYFRVIDSDDWVNIDEFTSYINDLEKLNSDIVLTNFSREYIYNSTQVISKYPKSIEYNKEYNLDNFDFNLLKNEYFYMATSTIKTSILKECNLHIDEKTFYVDMEYNIFPFPYYKTMTYLNYDIYRYFIGRPEQSISQGGFVNHRKDHEKVLKKLIDFYTNLEVDNNRKKYIKKILLLTLDSHYVIYCYSPIEKDLTNIMRKEIRDFTKYLKKKNIELYNEFLNTQFFAKANIKTNFIFASTKHNYFTRIMYIIQNRRKHEEDISN